MGWKYDWVADLPEDVYAVLIEELNKQHESQQQQTP
jgi:hypothetical protein